MKYLSSFVPHSSMAFDTPVSAASQNTAKSSKSSQSKRYFKLYRTLAVGSTCLLLGCETMQRGTPPPDHQPQINALRAESRENFRFYQEETAMLKNRVDALQDSFSAVAERINNLQQQMQTLNRQNHELNSRLVATQSALEQESRLRAESEKRIIDTVSRQIATATTAVSAAAAEAARPAQPAPDRGGVPVGPGSFYKYEVEAGATLSAIARAANVTVEEIKRANRLDSDVIRVGQTLYIPKK